jgi:serpin B
MKNTMIFCVLLFFSACNQSDKDIVTTDPTIHAIELSAGGDMIVNSSNNFGLDIFQKIILNEPEDKNVFISPTSISLALAMTWNGANGTTLDSMAYALRFPDLPENEINTINHELIEGLTTADEKVQLFIANSIWYRQDFQVEQDFIDVNQNYYDAEVRSLDFASPDAKDIINGWVEDKTNDKIKDLISEINPEHVMFLIDAIYFKGIWKTGFDEECTKDSLFYLNDGAEKTVRMMNMLDTIPYLENDLFQAVELDYGIGNFSMIILLPQSNHTVNDLVTELTSENWLTWMDSFTDQEVGFLLPKFSFDYEKELNDVLTDMGMGIAFIRNIADFTRINSNGNLYIDYVKHKSFVEVNEEGTEAAAATVVAVGETSIPGNPPQIKYMTVNRPFVFVIREKSTQAIVFIGRVANPEAGE